MKNDNVKRFAANAKLTEKIFFKARDFWNLSLLTQVKFQNHACTVHTWGDFNARKKGNLQYLRKDGGWSEVLENLRNPNRGGEGLSLLTSHN